ncbi:uncharacterized protein LOC135387282 [Ornithodoros turicata]|uniref:uncharacterized protein LOC135387282 n=1 Tax=Ornithodoros turicata TaxID=34597 RepID=UPI003138D288
MSTENESPVHADSPDKIKPSPVSQVPPPARDSRPRARGPFPGSFADTALTLVIVLAFVTLTSGIIITQLLTRKTVRRENEVDGVGSDGDVGSDGSSYDSLTMLYGDEESGFHGDHGGRGSTTSSSTPPASLASVSEVTGTAASSRGEGSTEPAEGICQTQGCKAFGSFLRGFINNSIHPCEDFHAFVSGKASKDFSYKQYGAGEATMVLDKALLYREVDEPLSAIDKATILFQGCMREKTSEDIRTAYEFVNKFHLHFDEKLIVAHNDDPMSIMISMGSKLGNGILFSMDTFYGSAWDSNNVIKAPLEIRPNDDFVQWLMSARDDRKLMLTLIQSYAPDLEDPYGVHGGVVNATYTMFKIWNSTDVLKSAEWRGKLRDLSTKSRHVKSDDILRHINQKYVTHPFTEDDVVVVEHENLLRFIDNLISSLDKTYLIFQLTFEFLRQIDPYVREPNADKFAQKSSSYCYPLLEPYIGVATHIHLLETHSPNRDDQRVAKIYDDFKKSVQSYSDARVTSALTKDMTIEIGFPSDIRDNVNLEKLYSVFPNLTGIYLEDVLAWRAAYYGFRKQPRSELFIPLNALEPKTYYDPTLNKIVLSDTMFLPAFVAEDVNNAAAYGAIGGAIALQMAQAILSHGSWTDSSSIQWRNNKISCLKSTFKWNGTDNHIASFLLTNSLRRSFVNSSSKARIPQLEEYTAEQVLFMATCLMYLGNGTPAEGNWTNAELCNNPLKNSPDFALAFQCTKGSKMNSGSHCVLW